MKNQSTEQEKTTSEALANNLLYPSWLYEVFYRFSMIYKDVWTRNVITAIDRAALEKIYFDALNKFKPETIQSATQKHCEKYAYPELHQLVSLCEEISAASRYVEFQIEHKPETKEKEERKPRSEVAKKTIEEIRQKLRLVSK